MQTRITVKKVYKDEFKKKRNRGKASQGVQLSQVSQTKNVCYLSVLTGLWESVMAL